jgi:hypothetical protein
MKKLAFGLVAGLFGISGFASTINTQELDLQVGPSIPIFGSKSPAQYLGTVGYRYNQDWWYVGADAGGWAGDRHTGLADANIGLQYKDFSIGTGPAYITSTSTSLSTHYQFDSQARWTFNPYPVFIGFQHVSNGAKIFGGKTPNDGENFVTVGYIYTF